MTRTTRKKRKRRPKKIGNRALALLLAAIAIFSALNLQATEKRKKPMAATAVVAGTVFRDPGFALAGAEITLALEKAPPKARNQKTVSDARGEYAFRVPAEQSRYTVSVKANGFEGQQKTAEVNGEVRVDVFFQLKPVAK